MAQSHQFFELLKTDHRHVERLMEQISAASTQQRQPAFNTLRNELQAHFLIEEKFYYPRLQPVQDMKALVEDALDEHEEAKALLEQLNRRGVETEEWHEIFLKLEEGIRHHHEDEEQEIFPNSTQFLSDNEFNDIAVKCVREKEQFFARKLKEGAGRTARKSAVKEAQL
jgi:hemerythrin-like domain-containing protein